MEECDLMVIRLSDTHSIEQRKMQSDTIMNLSPITNAYALTKGNSYDNAFAESAIKTIKYNEVNMKEYETFEEAYANIKKFIEEVYNKKQLHSGIGYVPPEEFEKSAE